MPYIHRNKKGEIISLHDSPKVKSDQWLEVTDSEVFDFLKQSESSNHAVESLINSDHEMVRVIEDLIDLLMKKDIFNYTDLPEAVQIKLNDRKKLRKDANSLSGLIDEDDTIF